MKLGIEYVARKKLDPAVVRTIGMFTGKTALEEAADIAAEEAPGERLDGPRDMAAEAELGAIRWLGLDAFHTGDDVRVAVHAKGHAVLVLIDTTKTGEAYATRTFKLSKPQWSKLKKLARG